MKKDYGEKMKNYTYISLREKPELKNCAACLLYTSGISILDTCIILLSMAGAIFSITEAGNVGIDAYESVSYTHLDVYKRQLY